MKYLRTLLVLLTSAILYSAGACRAAAADDVVITEFMAENDNTLPDEDGDFPDWIELFNAGANTVNLDGWYLSDGLSVNLDNYWRFPATNIPPQGFLVVFASGKDRRVPGARLHTDFALNDNGDHVFLIKPDGVTIASQFGPNGAEYPRQVPGVSYGIPVTQTLSTLVASGASGKYFVPLSGSVDGLWLQPEFNDTTWGNAVTGVGYETDAATNIVVASSTADWSTAGNQGEKNWYYGYYNKTLDPGGVYQASNFIVFPRGAGAFAADNYWTGSMWDWFAGNPPWDEISQTGGHPNGNNNGQEHWVIRRWVSKVSGTITVDWFLAKANTGGGNGVTGRIYQNNTQRDAATIAFNNAAGTNRSVVITGVQVGDTIDYALDAFGTDGTAADGSDGSLFSMVIRAPVSLSNQISTSITASMKDIGSSAYLRIPFVVTNAASYDLLSLRMKYDDGFAAYLNSVPLAVRNSPLSPVWNSTATASRDDVDAGLFEEINVTPGLGALHDGTNILAIHGLNVSAGDSDFLILPELRAGVTALDRTAQRYFVNPTPNAPNDVGTTNLGPLIFNVEHTPNEPADSEDLVVTAQSRMTFNAISNLTLVYRIMFNNEVAVRMNDSGTNGDLLGGDGIYTGIIPASASEVGQMVRYFIRADDVFGIATRLPASSNSINAPAYFGTVVLNPSLVNPLPVLHLFIPDATLNQANGDSAGRYACSISYLGEFYDNIGINRHGQSSAGFPKKSYDLDFNPGSNFKWKEGEARVDDVNLLTTYPDKGHFRNALAYGVFRDAGAPYHFVEPIRVQTNGSFYGDWHLVENGDDNYLKRIGRDPNGAFYKMYNQFLDTTDYAIVPNSEAEKKTRKNESNADLIALYTGVNTGTLATRTNYMYDNINIAEMVNTLAARSVTSDWDCCHKNYYLYRDTDGTGEWETMPWDIDLSFGRNWSSSQNYWDDAVYPQNRIWGNWDNNGVFQLVLNMPVGEGIEATRQMYIRRVRTLMDELQQTNGTPVSQLRFESQIDELAAKIAPDAALDLAKWGTWGGGAVNVATNSQFWRTLPQSVLETKTNYLPARRNFIFNQNMGLTGNDLINWTNPQPADVVIQFGAIDYNPISRNQAEEYIQLLNTNRIAVDISGWKLAGAVEHTFQGGTVIPAFSSVYVVPDKKAFRARATAPRGGMGLYVEGQYKGQLSARGETILLSNKLGQLVRTNAYPGNPSAPQQYLRVTEIMYHPPKAGTTNDAELYEYIELRNTGPSTMDLTDVHFTSGILFNFTGSAVTSLAAGQRVLVVRSTTHFTERYGGGLNVAGEFVGVLDNAGENIQLDDAFNEKILDFNYDNAWYPVTDGPGASLVIKNDTAEWHTWNLAESWRPSAFDFGSPGQPDPTPTPVTPVLVNELLTHTDPPLVDAVEILNPNLTPANISGWFLSDDFATPKKYRIPDGTTIAPGGYLVLYESNSFGIGPNSFAFSSKGDEVYIYSGNGTNLTGYLHGYSVEASANGVSFGRYTNSQTNVHFVAQTTLSLGSANGSPRVGPVVISEISYHPAELAAGQDNQLDEYVELANISGAPVPLYDPAFPTSTWRLRGGVDFEFTGGTSLDPGEHILLVSFNPAYAPILATFRARNNVSPQVRVFGPFRGALNNDGENIRLYRPDTPETNEVPYILVDRIDYDNELPWGAAADGIGPSLQRRVESAYGNDPTNWIASVASPGVAYVAGGSPPSIVTPPANVTDIIGRTVMFSVDVAGTPPFSYRWRQNGAFIPGAFGQTLTLPNIQLSQAGNYSVIVFNSAGSIESSSATLTVLIPVSISQDPASLKMRGSTNNGDYGNATNNATFVVGANIQRPTRFQWRFNGLPIANATNSILVVSNVNFNLHEGTYDVTVSDAVSSTTSKPARLTVLLSPTLIEVPALTNGPPITVASNGSFSASVVIRGNPPPFFYRWNEGSTTRVTNTSDFRTNTMAYGPITNSGLRLWRVIVTNEANIAQTANSPFYILNLVDSDHDGIPDEWESLYNLDPNSDTDRNLDKDGDGLSNYAEYYAGTNPTNAANFLRVDLAVSPGQAQVQLGAISNRTYAVQYTDDLRLGLWQKLGTVLSRTNNRIETILDPGWTTNRFYRAVTPAP
jgi:hypothetical protein